MPDDARDTSDPQRPGTPRPAGEPARKPAGRGLPIGARLAILLAALVVLAGLIVLLATTAGGGSNGSTTGMAPTAGMSSLGAAPVGVR